MAAPVRGRWEVRDLAVLQGRVLRAHQRRAALAESQPQGRVQATERRVPEGTQATDRQA